MLGWSGNESPLVMSNLCDPMDYKVHGIPQARTLEWVAAPFSRGSSQLRDGTQVSHIAGNSLPAEPPWKPKNTGVGSLSLLQWIFLTQESNRGLLHCRLSGKSYTAAFLFDKIQYSLLSFLLQREFIKID